MVEAREALRGKALELFERYDKAIQDALAAEKFEVALDAMQWLIEHMPEEGGARMIEASVDQPKQLSGPMTPTIQIGFALGGIVAAPKQLPQAEPVDGETIEEVKESV